MRKLAHEEIPRVPESEIDSVDRHPIVLILDNIRSAHNVGSIFRSSDATRVDRIILSGYTPDPSHKGVRKAALGAGDMVPWQRTDSVKDTIAELRETGHTIAALEITTEPTDPRSLTRDRFPIAVIVGNEVDGVSEELLTAADLAIELPQFGAKQSLNVSVATGVALYDLVRAYRSL